MFWYDSMQSLFIKMRDILVNLLQDYLLACVNALILDGDLQHDSFILIDELIIVEVSFAELTIVFLLKSVSILFELFV